MLHLMPPISWRHYGFGVSGTFARPRKRKTSRRGLWEAVACRLVWNAGEHGAFFPLGRDVKAKKNFLMLNRWVCGGNNTLRLLWWQACYFKRWIITICQSNWAIYPMSEKIQNAYACTRCVFLIPLKLMHMVSGTTARPRGLACTDNTPPKT